MENFCENCFTRKHIKKGRYNLCEKCYNTLQKEYNEYKKHVKFILDFENYVKMVLSGQNIHI